MINLQEETLVSLREAAQFLPRRRAGRKTAISTLYRWTKRGVRGVRLETVKIGGTTCTSLQALQRFCDRLSAQHTAESSSVATSKTPLDRTAEQELESSGW